MRCSWAALRAPSWSPLTWRTRGVGVTPPRRRIRTGAAALHDRQQPQHQTQPRQEVGWQELHRAAQIAAWSGLCYLAPQELSATIQQKHKGLTLLASGRNEYTSWFIADGEVPAAHFCTTISSRGRNGGGGGGEGGGGPGVCARVPQGTRERFLFMRGVQWSAPDIDSTKLSQALWSVWPTPFPKGNGSGGGGGSSAAQAGGVDGSPLVAHAGVAGIAQELFSQLRPYLQQADDVGMPLCFAGHSLGGSLATLTLVLHHMHKSKRRAAPPPTCYTFGSPPVLAHERGGGGGGHSALADLGLPPGSVQNFVLEMDPVPRALASVDPTFELISSWSAVKSLLWLRERLAGPGPLSPKRFLFESVGHTHLITWSPEGGSQVVPLDAAEIQKELSMLAPKWGPGSSSGGASGGSAAAAAGAAAAGAGQQGPAGPAGEAAPNGAPAAGAAGAGGPVGMLFTSLRAWLDHNNRSYTQELEAAALRSVRQHLAAEGQQQQERPQQQQSGEAQQPQQSAGPSPAPQQVAATLQPVGSDAA